MATTATPITSNSWQLVIGNSVFPCTSVTLPVTKQVDSVLPAFPRKPIAGWKPRSKKARIRRKYGLAPKRFKPAVKITFQETSDKSVYQFFKEWTDACRSEAGSANF